METVLWASPWGFCRCGSWSYEDIVKGITKRKKKWEHTKKKREGRGEKKRKDAEEDEEERGRKEEQRGFFHVFRN